jgi:ribose 5-phosphate isomerase B
MEGDGHGYLRRMDRTIIIGSDHAGFALKEDLKQYLASRDLTVVDKGTASAESTDYPDYAHAVAEAIRLAPGALGILICGSGNGVNITANRHKGIRSALAWLPEVAALARAHNDANIIALPARFITSEQARAIVEAFLASSFEQGRHQRRVEKIDAAC